MPVERRPLDHALVGLAGKPEEELVAWWRARLEQIAAIPSPTGRAGALAPEWRELMTLPDAQRLALTRARVLAAEQLASDQRDRVFEARAIATGQLPDLAKADLEYVRDRVIPSMPADVQAKMRSDMTRMPGAR